MELAKEKRRHFLYHLFCLKEFFFNICVLSQCVVSKYTFRIYVFFDTSKHISYIFLLVFKIVKSRHCIHNIVLTFLFFVIPLDITPHNTRCNVAELVALCVWQIFIIMLNSWQIKAAKWKHFFYLHLIFSELLTVE